MPTEVLLVGAGGHAKVVIEALLSGGSVPFVCDQNKALLGELILGQFTIQALDQWPSLPCNFHICIGNSDVREALSATAVAHGKMPYSIVHPAAVVSSFASVGAGSFVAANATVAAEAVIGEHCIINHAAVVDHDSHVGSFSHIAPNATLCGGVSLGQGCTVGAGATILPGVSIGDRVVVGAGSVVSADIEGHQVVCGVPARYLKAHE